jgi:hypothetical protein
MSKLKLGVVNYDSDRTPSGYICSKCGAAGVKLWFPYTFFLHDVELMCVDCACVHYEIEPGTVNDLGIRENKHGMNVPSIGMGTPAIPHQHTLWGNSNVPRDHFNWWARLPLREENDGAINGNN